MKDLQITFNSKPSSNTEIEHIKNGAIKRINFLKRFKNDFKSIEILELFIMCYCILHGSVIWCFYLK